MPDRLPLTREVSLGHLTVTNLAGSGPGSLQGAILAANAGNSGTPSVIDFTVSGTITLTSALPPLANTVSIDASKAPGYAGSPVVELNCNGNAGLVFDADSQGSQLLGMAIGGPAGVASRSMRGRSRLTMTMSGSA